MKIGVLSDTHGSLHFFEKAMHVLKDCDQILHAGDILSHGHQKVKGGFSPFHLALTLESMDNILFAQGNCDSSYDRYALSHPLHYPYLLINNTPHPIMLCHGHHLKKREDLIRQAKDLSASILIYGHTHIKELSQEGSLTILNPGSTTLPRDGVPSVATIEADQIRLIDIRTGNILQSVRL